jgi:hypothetical protein
MRGRAPEKNSAQKIRKTKALRGTLFPLQETHFQLQYAIEAAAAPSVPLIRQREIPPRSSFA